MIERILERSGDPALKLLRFRFRFRFCSHPLEVGAFGDREALQIAA